VQRRIIQAGVWMLTHCMFTGSHLQRQENDAETGNRLSSSIEEPLLTESNQHKPTAAQQERRRALVQKALKQGSLSLKTGDGRDGTATDHKMSSVVSLNGELKEDTILSGGTKVNHVGTPRS
jgi:hypothetical protein